MEKAEWIVPAIPVNGRYSINFSEWRR